MTEKLSTEKMFGFAEGVKDWKDNGGLSFARIEGSIEKINLEIFVYHGTYLLTAKKEGTEIGRYMENNLRENEEPSRIEKLFDKALVQSKEYEKRDAEKQGFKIATCGEFLSL